MKRRGPKSLLNQMEDADSEDEKKNEVLDEEEVLVSTKINSKEKLQERIQINLMILASVACLTGGSIFYQNTLVGGTVEWIHEHMDYLVKNMMMAVMLYFTGLLLLILVKKHIQFYLWVFIMALVVIILGVVLTRDMGATLENHGLFNLLMLSVLMIPFLLYTGSWLLAFRLLGKKKGSILHISIIFTILFSLLYLKTEATRSWPYGLFGRKLTFESNGVKLANDFVPWNSLQPSGWNFIFGQSCPAREEFASLMDGILAIDCDPSRHPYYIEYPDFISRREDDIERMMDLVAWKADLRRTLNYTLPVETSAEVIQAFCGDEEMILMQAVEDKTILDRVTAKEAKASTPNGKPPNILMVFIDTLSRAHFLRKLTKTVDALNDIQESGQSDVFQFFKYHALGPHTGPNTVPMYTGGETIDESFNYTEDPLWWSAYDKSKYVNAWVPGFCESWSNTYLKKPFPEGSTDHWLGMPFCHPDAFPLKNPHSPINGPYSFRRRCIGGKRVHNYVLEYATEFFSTYTSAGKLATLVFMEGHEGTGEVISQLDGDLAEFLTEGLGDEKDNTFVFIVSDHGNHMSGYFLWSTVGKRENQLPALFVITPKWFKERYPQLAENVLENENRLVTAFDIYDTLVSLNSLPEFSGNATSGSTPLKGLLEVVPDRGCKEAKIPEKMCAFVNYTL